ncbi:MAG: aromatic amino acid hydroxylase [Crocinitomicaceae bacterium]|jgi:phenylalanine-4-hydroxylase|nr:aromatic amino acid hydroxylase [Crocinitomicaceae bacterium]
MEETIESNELIDRLPPHLKQFIKPQNYADYSPIDQAVWRYVMRKNVDYLSKFAHESYLEGLRKTGISIDQIPSMYGMNRILKEIGWAAVAVDGFIPPNAFMEFQAYKVLVIASDIRQLENIEYTPAPDIIHEAAGHAPIIANPDYAEYLRRLGAIGAKAILSHYDIELYEAVRKLSILKEAIDVSPEDLAEAEKEVDRLQAMDAPMSEMALIRNLQWWSVEYGLIGNVDDPKIYGAGLLSSIGESKSCMDPKVEKLPYSAATSLKEFDITQPQPQLYVTPDFPYLMQVLEEISYSLSIRKGGHRGLRKLIDSGMIGTIELSTGLQISGKFTRMIQNEDLEVIYFQTEGPTALAYREKALIGHGVSTHPNGFSSPLGKLKSINLAIEDMGPVDLKAYNFYDGQELSFEFESGIKVVGLNVTGIRNVQGKLMVIQLANCTVTYGEEVLFQPEWGVFDMAVGKEILSAYAGAADYLSFPNLYQVSKTTTIKQAKTTERLRLEYLYSQVREMRTSAEVSDRVLANIFAEIKTEHPGDWLLSVEILELCSDVELRIQINEHLSHLAQTNLRIAHLIEDGVQLIRGKAEA